MTFDLWLLIAHHDSPQRKQAELGDKMDLSSYLLKPVQRMSKYALLLADLIKEVGSAQEAELAALLTATDMVKFQLRHGNDLLAMDAVRDCDVSFPLFVSGPQGGAVNWSSRLMESVSPP